MRDDKSDKIRMFERVRILKYEPKISTTETKKLNKDKIPFINWTANLRIEKYNNDESYKSGVPDEIQTVEGNTATMKGLFTIWNLVQGKDINSEVTYDNTTYTGVYPLNADYAYLGVGSGDTPATSADTGLASTPVFLKCDTGYPIIDAANPNTLQLRVTFSPSDAANMDWKEWGVANGDADRSKTPVSPRDADNIVLFNRRVENMGHKSDQATWVIIADLVISPTAS